MSEAATVSLPVVKSARNSVLIRMAERFGVDAQKLHSTLKATAFRGDVSDEQFLALMIVADQYKLNPLTKEIYAFPDKNNGIVPVVGVDGWGRIINEHPQFNGLEFTDGTTNKDGVPEWIECTIYRRDREHPVKVREYMVECKRGTGPWGSHPRRMLRHKALIQCARLAFGFVGIYDQDEAERIVEGTATIVTDAPEISAINDAIKPRGNGESPPENQPRTPKPKQPAPAKQEEPVSTYVAIAERIMAAENGDQLDELADLARSLPEAQRAEVDVEIRAKRKALA